MMVLYYIRHGQPIYELNKLTELGQKQADAVGERLALLGIDKIFSSPSNRAIETAMPLSRVTGKEIEILDFADEDDVARDFMVDDGTGVVRWASDVEKIRTAFAMPDIKTRYDWYQDPIFSDYNFGEGIRRIDKATDSFLERLGYRHNRKCGYFESISPTEEKIALFAHAGFGQVFMSSVLDIPYPQIANQFVIGNTGVSRIHFEVQFGICVPRVHMFSSDAHIYKKNLPEI